MLVEVWSDLVCPFCFLGKARLNQALTAWQHADHVEIRWRSFELDPQAPAQLPGGLVGHIATKYGLSEQQATQAQQGIAAQFEQSGGSFDWRAAKPGNTFNAHRVCHLAADQGVGTQVMDELMRGYFSQGAPIGEPETVADLATRAGLETALVEEVLGTDAYADAVRADEATASQLGISGVPFFVFDARLAVSGAQPVEVFTRALDQAWDSRSTEDSRRTDAPDTDPGDASKACGPDNCATSPA
ncbi:MAG: DsbA family oxidoreductase [Actinomycetales bacterium]